MAPCADVITPREATREKGSVTPASSPLDSEIRRASSSSSVGPLSVASGGNQDDECDLDGGNGTNIYVSELPASMSLPKLRALFAPYGVILAVRLVPRRKGYLPVGFVQFTTAESARASIAALDRQNLCGSVISVRLARRDKDKGVNSKPSNTLYVANLPRRFTEADLRVVFSRYGDVRSLLVFKHPETGVSKGSALVRFVDVTSARCAKEALHCSVIKGHDLPMEVKFAESKHDKQIRVEGTRVPAPRRPTPPTPPITPPPCLPEASLGPLAIGKVKELRNSDLETPPSPTLSDMPPYYLFPFAEPSFSDPFVSGILAEVGIL